MAEQKPSIGRIVRYQPVGSERGNNNNGEYAPAIITQVFDSAAVGVNLRVFFDGEVVGWRTSVLEGDNPGQWSWPPRV